MASSSAPWCDQRAIGHRPQLLVALGISSHEGHTTLRSAMRATSFAMLPFDVEVAFVLRGIGLQNESQLAAEAAAHADLWLVRASATLPRSVGPLVTQLLWFKCAARAHPAVPWIGRADDDGWLRVDALPILLTRVGEAMAVRNSSRALVGSMFTYKWYNDSLCTPLGLNPQRRGEYQRFLAQYSG